MTRYRMVFLAGSAVALALCGVMLQAQNQPGPLRAALGAKQFQASSGPASSGPGEGYGTAALGLEEWLRRKGLLAADEVMTSEGMHYVGLDTLSIGQLARECFEWRKDSLAGHLSLVYLDDTLVGDYVTTAEFGGPMLGVGLLDLINRIVSQSISRCDLQAELGLAHRLFFDLAFPLSHSNMVLTDWSGVPALVTGYDGHNRGEFEDWLRSVDSTFSDSALAQIVLPQVLHSGTEDRLICYYWDTSKQELRVFRSTFVWNRFVWADSRAARHGFNANGWGE